MRRDKPVPMFGFAFYCSACGEVCQAVWGDFGYGPHDWGWRSDCCFEPFREDIKHYPEKNQEGGNS